MSVKTYWMEFGSGNGASFTGLTPTFILFQTAGGSTITPPGITERITGASGTGAYQFSAESSSFPIFFRVDGGGAVADASRWISGVLDPVLAVDNQVTAEGVTLVALGSTVVGIGTTLIAQGSTITGIGTTLLAQGSTVVGIGTTLLGIGSTIFGIGVTQIAEGATILGIGTTLLAIGSTLIAEESIIGTLTDSFGTNSIDPTSVIGYLKRLQEFNEGNATFNKITGCWTIDSRGSSTTLATKTLTNTATTATKT